jgi:hypothetical protein
MWLSGFSLSHFQRNAEPAGILSSARKITIDGIIARSDIPPDDRPDLTKPDAVEHRELTNEERAAANGAFESLIAVSAVVLLIYNRLKEVDELCGLISLHYRADVGEKFLQAVESNNVASDEFSAVVMGCIVERARLKGSDRLHPNELARLQLYMLQLAQLGSIPDFARERLMLWMKEQWMDTLNNQAFLLKMPSALGRQLHSLVLDSDHPLSSSAKIVGAAIDHISVSVSEEFRALIRRLSDADSLGFSKRDESESLVQIGGFGCELEFHCVGILMLKVFGVWLDKANMRPRRVVFWHSPRSMTAARARMRRAWATSRCRSCGTGSCVSTNVVLMG